jgi:demethylmenaquinone methyltransferase/2-methoxy-6-polyprenyl-1,4-benzoquinol methylase
MQNSTAELVLDNGSETGVLVPYQSDYDALVKRKRAEFAHLAPQYDLQCLIASVGRIKSLRRKLASIAKSEVEGPVLELCCGTGGVTVELAKHFDHVVAVDLSPDMLARNVRRLAKAGVKNVTLIEAEVSRLRFPESAFSAVVISLGLHELPQWIREKVFFRSTQWLKPRGRFVMCDYSMPKNRVLGTLFKWIGRLLIEEEHFDEYLGYEMQERLQHHGFEMVEQQHQFLSCLETSAWTLR